MRSHFPRLALASLLATAACARGTTPEDDASVAVDTAKREDAPDDTTVADAAPSDAADVVARDVPGDATVDATSPDATAFDATPDAAPLDVSPDVTPIDAAPDVAPLDVAPDLLAPDVVTIDLPRPEDVRTDTGPATCTPATAAALCGTRPCVDGYCCDSACTGACRTCALAGSEGRCTNYVSATDPESECPEQAPSTCGTTGVCNGAGACARHPMGTPCDDSAACTSADTCDGLGVCRGAAPVACAPGSGNQCCLASCDPAMGCRTTPGLCADVCDANRLQTGRSCQGCGAAGAAGTCGGGGDFACDATSHSLCRAIPCGGQSFYCTNDGGVWQWRTAARCDDGNPCTHTDGCAAGACAGAAVSCVSDVCATRACTGAPTCAVTPHPGAMCDDGNTLTNSDVCSAAGACVGTVVCGLPTDACGDGAQNRDRCAGARVIGRRTAATTAGFTTSANTCSASNRFDDCSWDAGADHAYRLWARAGETLTVNLTTADGCFTSSWDATLKLYQGGDCGTVTCSGDRWCRDFVGTGAQTYVAPRDGWIVLVVDGSTAFDDEGTYTLRVRLTGCRGLGCECP